MQYTNGREPGSIRLRIFKGTSKEKPR
jgi:hypothetical protein